MRGFLKLFLPPFCAFVVFAAAVRFDALYHRFHFGQISDGTVHSLMAYFYFFWPLLFVDALLTQGVIIIPLWNRLHHGALKSRITAISLLIFICLIFSLGVSFMMWGSLDYFFNWMRSFMVMITVQLMYWFIVLGVLGMLDSNRASNEKNV